MAFHNVNFAMVPMPVGTYDVDVLGDNLTASTVHEVYCVSAGSIQITASGGGTATFAMTAGQSVKVMARKCVVSSGSFVGFKAAFQGNSIRIFS
jgi:hypothetical protein